MNRQIRGLAGLLLFCFVLLFVQVNILQVGHTSCPGLVAAVNRDDCRRNLDNDPRNVRAILRDFSRTRGTVTTADGVVLAKSVPSDDQYVWQRQFPTGDLFGQVTGYFSLTYGSSGVERQYNDELAGQTADQKLRSFSDLFVSRDRSGNLTLTLRNDLQTTARNALGDRKGSVVVLDPRTGELLALWSNPSYDPNPLAHHDTEDAPIAQQTKTALDADPAKPLLAKAWGEIYQPGSTFKLVTGSVGVETGKVTADTPVYPPMQSYRAPVPYGSPLRNFDGEVCGGSLITILAQSCNTAFAQMGTETIGPTDMISGAAAFGFDGKVPLDLPGGAVSTFRPPPSEDDPKGDFTRELPRLAQASIGQDTVAATPLQMALVMAAIAHDGTIMEPHVLDEVRDTQGNLIRKVEPKTWRSPISADTAALLREATRQVVLRGTATGMAVPGFDVGAKTGTAEIGDGTPASPLSNNAWMVAWGGPPNGDPQVVVVVLVPNVPGYGNNSTGSAVAGPAAREILAKALEVTR